jgi:hypothetical protein
MQHLESIKKEIKFQKETVSLKNEKLCSQYKFKSKISAIKNEFL